MNGRLILLASVVAATCSMESVTQAAISVSLTMVPKGPIDSCPSGDAINRCVVADYANHYVNTWDYVLVLTLTDGTQYTDIQDITLNIAYSSTGVCSKLAAESALNDAGGWSVKLDHNAAYTITKTDLSTGSRTLIFNTHNAFPVGDVGHDQHRMQATLDYTLNSAPWTTVTMIARASAYDTVPEPAAFGMMAIGAALLIRRKR